MTTWIERGEAETDARRYRAHLYVELGDLERACVDLDRVLELEPDDEALRTRRGLVRLRRGDWGGACSDLWESNAEAVGSVCGAILGMLLVRWWNRRGKDGEERKGKRTPKAVGSS